MSLPVRCFTCGKVIGHLWDSYVNMLKNDIPVDVALAKLGIRRICCKRMIKTHVDLTKEFLENDYRAYGTAYCI